MYRERPAVPLPTRRASKSDSLENLNIEKLSINNWARFYWS
jgi:hypothetical protein